MRRRLSVVAVAIAVLAGISAVLWLSIKPTAGQGAVYRASRLTGTARPDLNGVWQAVNTANWNLEAHPARPALAVVRDPNNNEVPAAPVLALGAIGGVPAGESVVEGGTIPYQAWAAAKRKENSENALTRDPEIKCYLPGVPRATYMPYPLQIFQSANSEVVIAYEFTGATRTIHMGKPERSPSDSWMGWSNGRWDGDTLVIEAADFNGETWFDRAGNFHSDALKVTERYTLSGPDHLQYEATIEDPTVFTRPWKISMPLYRRKDNARLLEYKCVEFVEELMYGHLRKEQLVKHWEADYGEEVGGNLIIDITRRR